MWNENVVSEWVVNLSLCRKNSNFSSLVLFGWSWKCFYFQAMEHNICHEIAILIKHTIPMIFRIGCHQIIYEKTHIRIPSVKLLLLNSRFRYFLLYHYIMCIFRNLKDYECNQFYFNSINELISLNFFFNIIFIFS